MVRVFIAEDDPLVRQALKLFVEAGGHESVGEASSVETAISAVTDLESIEVAILDGRMPRIGDGARLAVYLRERFPNVKIISLAGQGEQFGDINLQKPIEIAGFLEAIQEALET